MRAALYARVSSKAQAEEDKVSIAEQFSDMESYCQRQGYEAVRRYQDVASGSTKRRPDFQRMLADASSGLFDVILCWKSDRLSRGIYPAAAIMEVVEAYQIRIEAVMDTVDIKTFAIYAAVGKIEIDNFRERATMGKRGVAKRGRVPVGSIPYGYRIGEDGKPEVEPVEGPTVQKIFREYAHEGKGAHIIARELTEQGTPLRRGSKWQAWSTSYIHRILQHEAYKGTNWYGQFRHVITESGKKLFRQPKENWIAIPYPQLVDEQTWERTQAMKKQRKEMAKRNTRNVYLLQGLLLCKECGLRFRARSQRQSTTHRRGGRSYTYILKKPRSYYICLGTERYRLKCRKQASLRADALDGLVWDEVARILREPSFIFQALQAQADGRGPEELAEKIAKAEQEMRAVQLEEDLAIRLYITSKVTEAQLDRQRKFITERLERIRAELASLKAQQRAIQERQALSEGILAWTAEIKARLDNLSPEERQQLLRLVLDKVTIDSQNRVQITLAISAPELVPIDSQRPYWWWWCPR